MKNPTPFLSAVTFLFVGISSSFGQGCIANPIFSNDTVGIYPSGPMQTDCSGINAYKTIVGLTDVLVSIFPNDTAHIYFNALRIADIVGLPSGLTLETDVMSSATGSSPYGIWDNIGAFPVFNSAIGCFNITGAIEDWANAAIGGSNGDGVYYLNLQAELRVDTCTQSATTCIAFLITSSIPEHRPTSIEA